MPNYETRLVSSLLDSFVIMIWAWPSPGEHGFAQVFRDSFFCLRSICFCFCVQTLHQVQCYAAHHTLLVKHFALSVVGATAHSDSQCHRNGRASPAGLLMMMVAWRALVCLRVCPAWQISCRWACLSTRARERRMPPRPVSATCPRAEDPAAPIRLSELKSFRFRTGGCASCA